MKLLNKIPPMGKKGTVAGLVICFVAMIALVGTFTVTNYQESQKEQVADNSKLESKEKDLLKNSKDDKLDLDSENVGTQEQANANDEGTGGGTTQEANADNIVNSADDMDGTTLEEIANAREAEIANKIPVEDNQVASNHVEAHFNDGDSLTWPVNGGVIMKYNMEETVYFETLDQYKRNPAMIIDGEVGDAVVSAATGVVTKIETDREVGQTVTIDMGNGYEAVYGQLEGISVHEGVYVEEGEAIGILAEPTKYYSVEGCNLYFQLKKDGKTVDPLEYLE